MDSDLDTYRKVVETQKEELYELLARIGLDYDREIDIPIPDENTPLAELYVATKIAADNLRVIIDNLNKKISEAETYAKTVELQSAAIRELSTPIIQLTEGILILPLIGFVDTSRAAQITEQLLKEISNRQSDAVIIDLTGLFIIDTQVASYIIKTIQAAKLLGAKAIITGISPENAQTLINIGISVVDVITKGTLQNGLDYALSLINKKIVEIDLNVAKNPSA